MVAIAFTSGAAHVVVSVDVAVVRIGNFYSSREQYAPSNIMSDTQSTREPAASSSVGAGVGNPFMPVVLLSNERGTFFSG